MGFNYTMSQLLSAPTYIFAIVASFAVAAISDKFRLRWPFIVAQCTVCCVGLLIVLYADRSGVRYFGLYLGIYGAQSNLPMFLSYAQNQITNVEKKGAFAAAMITIGAAGGTTGSTIFRPVDAPVSAPVSSAFYLPIPDVWLMNLGADLLSRDVDDYRTPGCGSCGHICLLDVAQTSKQTCR